MAPDLRADITAALADFERRPLYDAAKHFFTTLGYMSSRTLAVNSMKDLRQHLDPNGFLNERNALLSKWKSVHVLFQLTPEDVGPQQGQQGILFEKEDEYDPKIVKSYLFFALELDTAVPGRGDLGLITRALNRLVPIPVFVLFKHGSSISLAIVNRRKNMRDGTRDVLMRVSFIRDINIRTTHRAHLDMLLRFALPTLAKEGAIRTFKQLDDAWQKMLSVQELNESFYKDLVGWFKWAVEEIHLAQLPDYVSDTPQNRARATQEFTVRLICRSLFAWFLKEMELIPKNLLELHDAVDRPCILTEGAGDFRRYLQGNQYYRGILQNIFFQALNRPMDQRRKSGPAAANDRTVKSAKLKALAYIGKNQLPEDFEYDIFDRIPYLNGGLFDALPEDNASDTIEDGAFRIPNKLFYARREDGFSIAVGTGKRKAAIPMQGLNRIFDQYRFTVAENTPLEEDVALDPELLGLVFENLLAEIDPDDQAAAETARKASGSYYTPRRIVDYMVNEAMHLHLRTAFEKQGASEDELRLLSRLCYDMAEGPDFTLLAERVVEILDNVRILDPACGSGAFPMGMLHRMVELLGRVDPDNALWKHRLLERLPPDMRADAARGMEGRSYNYLRKLGLIQKNLYGVDIQPLAALIAKLRFFLTLVIEQEVDQADRNHNYRLQALPNLETNLLCANTLVDAEHGLLSGPILAQLRGCRERYYQPETSAEQRNALATEIGEQLATLFPGFAEQTKGIKPQGAIPMERNDMRRQQDAYWLAEWFKHATVAAPFFNVETFFPELVVGENASPFHIVIGNPPYGGTKIPDEVKAALALGSKDPYGAFIARFLGDLKRPSPIAEDGVLAYIVSDTFMTIKTHRPLREQMMQNRIHKMLRVSGDTFKATVNCAVIICQRGAPSEHQTCQMADLTNVSIHEQYERFLHLLYQTEGFVRRQNISNQTYAIYHYRQSLIKTNSNLPFFVASPKLFALMNDITAPVTHDEIGGKKVPIRTVMMNGRAVRLVKLGEIAEVKVGLQTGDNDAYLFQKREARGTYRAIEEYEEFLQTEDDLERIRSDNNLRLAVIHNGISKDDPTSPRYFEGRYIVPYDKGGESDSDMGWMPNYWVPTNYFIDWSEGAISRMKTHLNNKGRPTARFQNAASYFQRGITFSWAGEYSPSFRISSNGTFDHGSSILFPSKLDPELLLPVLCSKSQRSLSRTTINHTVNFGVDDVKDIVLPIPLPKEALPLVKSIVQLQSRTPRYDYASNEQIEIDRLVYEAYGLNEGDIREVEDWYARRYPKLAKAQRRALAAKQGKTEDELVDRPVIHLYCDESRHLPYDREPCLLMGLVSAPADEAKQLNQELSEISRNNGLPLHFEAKWTKVSPAKLDYYKALVEWFFGKESLAFRATVLPDKQRMYAALPEDSRDHLYYRLYYQFLRAAVEPENRYRAFLDLKDTRGREKIAQLKEILAADADDAEAVQSLQHIHSHEVRLAQINDLLLGAVGYARRTATAKDSPAKRALVQFIGEQAGFPLAEDSPPGEDKFIVSTWHDGDALLL